MKLFSALKRRRGRFEGYDLGGLPTHECVCGCGIFKTLVSFDEGKIAWYALTGYCYLCNNRVTLPTEIDEEDYSRG